MLKVNKKKSNKETETQNIKEGQNRGMLCERNIETKVEKLKLGFLGTSMHAQT